MAAVAKVIFQGNNIYHINVTGTFSASDESDTVIIDKSGLTGPDGVNEPGAIRIDEISYALDKYDFILLEWDYTAGDQVIEILTNEGIFDYRESGGKNPVVGAGTGDVVLTSSGGAAGGAYSILMKCRLRFT